jgi:hypothetical protein
MERIGDSFDPAYSFQWDNGTERQTDDSDVFADDIDSETRRDVIELLASVGRQDENCAVEVVGF